ncbi:MAG: hypothetical protein N3E45_04230 [Oscillatoriaceae bacterium SKW80]|nr:hypothetical protein [Oscillatoriaceae bacterium SKYG93]MCX8120026.1 hypothetical protein [Oscillatoriaceae bacterium SKW80]MDW8454030.1 hypothetical protein [Oscillatoriaceae cyanobacterium SKYGB_i_bin93]HIK29728.1 hypothetical protein [Oscillatoriaceae cyanobacterium M7585_C2015_266]
MSLSNVQQRVPLIHDQLLIDLVNGIHTNKSLTAYRASRSLFGKFVDSLRGCTYEEALLQLTHEIFQKLQFAEYAGEPPVATRNARSP